MNPKLSGILAAQDGDGEKHYLEILSGKPEMIEPKSNPKQRSKIFIKAKMAKKKIQKFIDTKILNEERLMDLIYIVYCGFIILIILV